MNFNNYQLEEIAALVDIKKMQHHNAAKLWLSKNEKIWKTWLPTKCKIH
jgi:ABC-type proline/glycine betaine transport system substrate-binding protein